MEAINAKLSPLKFPSFEVEKKTAEDAKTTAIALLILSLCIAAIGFILLGAGVHPSFIAGGFAFVISFIGFHFLFLSVGTFIGSLVAGVVACRSRKS